MSELDRELQQVACEADGQARQDIVGISPAALDHFELELGVNPEATLGDAQDSWQDDDANPAVVALSNELAALVEWYGRGVRLSNFVEFKIDEVILASQHEFEHGEAP